MEVLLTVVIIGIIIALLTPKVQQIKEEALRQVARQQVKVFEKALADWYAAQPSIKQASDLWNLNADSNGYINKRNFILNSSSNTAALQPYFDLQPGTGNFPFTVSPTGTVLTPEMQQIPVAPVDGSRPAKFIQNSGTGSSDVPADLNYAHMRLFWDPSNRNNTSPKVLFFLPYPINL